MHHRCHSQTSLMHQATRIDVGCRHLWHSDRYVERWLYLCRAIVWQGFPSRQRRDRSIGQNLHNGRCTERENHARLHQTPSVGHPVKISNAVCVDCRFQRVATEKYINPKLAEWCRHHNINPQAQNLLRALLNLDPSARPTAEEALKVGSLFGLQFV